MLSNQVICQTLRRLHTLLVLKRQSNNLALALRQALDIIQSWQVPAETILANTPPRVLFAGLGPKFLKIFDKLIVTGHIPLLDELQKDFDPFFCELCELPGIGETMARRMFFERMIESPDDLRLAYANGILEKIPAFGQGRIKTIEQWLWQQNHTNPNTDAPTLAGDRSGRPYTNAPMHAPDAPTLAGDRNSPPTPKPPCDSRALHRELPFFTTTAPQSIPVHPPKDERNTLTSSAAPLPGANARRTLKFSRIHRWKTATKDDNSATNDALHLPTGDTQTPPPKNRQICPDETAPEVADYQEDPRLPRTCKCLHCSAPGLVVPTMATEATAVSCLICQTTCAVIRGILHIDSPHEACLHHTHDTAWTMLALDCCRAAFLPRTLLWRLMETAKPSGHVLQYGVRDDALGEALLWLAATGRLDSLTFIDRHWQNLLVLAKSPYAANASAICASKPYKMIVPNTFDGIFIDPLRSEAITDEEIITLCGALRPGGILILTWREGNAGWRDVVWPAKLSLVFAADSHEESRKELLAKWQAPGMSLESLACIGDMHVAAFRRNAPF